MGKNAVIAIDIGGTKTLCALVSERFEILHAIKFKTSPHEGRPTFSKRLIGKSQLVVYARTKTNEIVHARFMLTGLDRAIGPVEQACRWPGSSAHTLALRPGRQSAAQ